MRLRDSGVREVTLLGQNVNSYHDRSEASVALYTGTDYATSAGFGNTFRSRGGAGAYFAELLAEVRRLFGVLLGCVSAAAALDHALAGGSGHAQRKEGSLFWVGYGSCFALRVALLGW